MEAKDKVTAAGRAMIGGRLGLRNIKSTFQPTIADQHDSFSIFSSDTTKISCPKNVHIPDKSLSFRSLLTSS